MLKIKAILFLTNYINDQPFPLPKLKTSYCLFQYEVHDLLNNAYYV